MKYYIVGAGGFGREMLSWLKQTPDAVANRVFGGFLDDNPKALERFSDPELRVVDSPGSHAPESDAWYFCGIGTPAVRLRIGRAMSARGAFFPMFRHPSAVVGDRCEFGVGTILCPGALVSADVTCGDFVLLNAHATVGHDARIGAGCTLSGHADVTGYAELGECAFMGSHAAVIPGAKVGAGAVVGAGSVVLRSAKPGSTVVGVPAKQISP